MSIENASLSGSPAHILGPTLADVMLMLPGIDVSAQARQNMMSAIRTVCRVLEREPRAIAIAAPVLRRLLEDASPGSIGLSPTRWNNVKSDVRRAIKLSGLSSANRETVPLTDAWERVAVLAPNATQRSVLRRFGRFCCSCQLAPELVDDRVVDQYAAFLDANQLSKSPARTIKDLTRTWNDCIAPDPSKHYAKLAVHNGSRGYTAPWADMPAGLAADAARFKAESLRPDPLRVDPFGARAALRPVRNSTAAQRDRMIRRLVTAEILAGVPREELNSLADVVHPDRLQCGLKFLLDRNGGTPNKQTFDMVHLARTIAKCWVRLPDDQLSVISNWVRGLDKRQVGLTEKNRDRLRQFTGAEVIGNFVRFPDRLIENARKMPANSRSAKIVQTALAIMILTVAPVRIGNLCILERGKHLKRAFSVDNPTLQLVLSRDEVKNRVDLRFPIPDRIQQVLDLYMNVYQPLLTNGHPSSLLFPGRSGRPLKGAALGRNIMEAIRKHCGLHVNPHLFRHLAAFLYLKRNPGQYEPVRQFLGHKSIQTTINFYAGFLNDQATELYGGVIDDLRGDVTSECTRKRRKRSG